ncbi:hypothetical protein SESBI_49913 [Sesbania bispinosa]|nr:hypothetical protein SESBI_49913 [Sesbania bispinosa]
MAVKCSNLVSSTARLEWKPTQDSFSFKSFGLQSMKGSEKKDYLGVIFCQFLGSLIHEGDGYDVDNSLSLVMLQPPIHSFENLNIHGSPAPMSPTSVLGISPHQPHGFYNLDKANVGFQRLMGAKGSLRWV